MGVLDCGSKQHDAPRETSRTFYNRVNNRSCLAPVSYECSVDIIGVKLSHSIKMEAACVIRFDIYSAYLHRGNKSLVEHFPRRYSMNALQKVRILSEVIPQDSAVRVYPIHKSMPQLKRRPAKPYDTQHRV